MADAITSLRQLKQALDAQGVAISERNLKDLMDDGCPGKSSETGEYELDRVREYLVERGIIEPATADDDEGDTVDAPQIPTTDSTLTPEVNDPANSTDEEPQRFPEGTMLCPRCGPDKPSRLPIAKTEGPFQRFAPCPVCNYRSTVKRMKPTARQLLKQQREKYNGNRAAVERP